MLWRSWGLLDSTELRTYRYHSTEIRVVWMCHLFPGPCVQSLTQHFQKKQKWKKRRPIPRNITSSFCSLICLVFQKKIKSKVQQRDKVCHNFHLFTWIKITNFLGRPTWSNSDYFLLLTYCGPFCVIRFQLLFYKPKMQLFQHIRKLNKKRACSTSLSVQAPSVLWKNNAGTPSAVFHWILRLQTGDFVATTDCIQNKVLHRLQNAQRQRVWSFEDQPAVL